MSSSRHRCVHSNSSHSGQCPSNSLQDLSSISSDDMENRRLLFEQQRLRARASNDRSCHRYSRQSESLAEEELIERLKEVINEFMTRPVRRHSYNTTMRWTVDHGNEINYSVVILINQPSELI